MNRSLCIDKSAIEETAMAYSNAVSFNASNAGICALCGYINDIMWVSNDDFKNIESILKPSDCWRITLLAYFTVISRLSSDVPEYIKAKSEIAGGHYPKSYGKRASKKNVNKRKISSRALLPSLISGIDGIGFEPKWLMEYRGANKRLSNNYPFNIWGYVRSLLIDYEQSVAVTPPYVIKSMDKIPGLKKLVDRAIHDGHIEMRRRYGDDVDLRPRVDGKIPEKYTPVFSSSEMMKNIERNLHHHSESRIHS